jgi:3',5'-cyclic AMP phosphodiesterase CpdA
MVAGQKRGVDAPAMWRGFHAAVTDPLEQAGIAVAPTPGNHDASPTFTEERAEYAQQWQRRSSRLSFVDASDYPLRYSFTFGGAFFLSLDAAAVGPVSREQRAWVEDQLTHAEQYSPKVAFGHLPLYPIAHGREREIVNDRALEALFAKHGVDVYLSGHQHAYYPGASNGMRHVSMPCLGAGARALIGTARASAQALVLLDVDAGELGSVEAFRAPDFVSRIERAALPARIALGQHVLTRDDVQAR